MNESKKNFIYRFTLSMLILISLGLNALTMAKAIIHKPNEYVFSCVVLVILSIFALFELVMTLVNCKKEPSLSKITRTQRGYFNPIPLIAVTLGVIISLGLMIPGFCLYFLREELVIKCNALVIFDVGFFLFINCFIYYLYVLMHKKSLIGK